MNLIDLSNFIITDVTPFILLFSIILIFVLVYFNRIKLLQIIKSAKINWKLCALCVFIYFVLMFVYSPRVNLWYTDEYEYLEIAKNIRFTGKANFYCEYYELDSFHCKTPYVSIGYPVALSMAYFLFGFNSSYAIYLSMIAGALCVALIYIISSILFNKKAGFYSALIYALIPYTIIWAGTAEPNVFCTFTILASLFSLIAYVKKKSFSLLLLSVLLLVISLYSRYESVLILPAFLFLLYKSKYKLKNFSVVFGLLMILTIPCFMQLFINLSDYSDYDKANIPKGSFSPANIVDSFNGWIKPFVLDKTVSWLFSILFLIGLLTLWKKQPDKLVFLVLIIIPYVAFTLFYHKGSSSGRIILPFLFAYSIIAGSGVLWLINKRIFSKYTLINTFIICIIASLVFVKIGHNQDVFRHNVFSNLELKKAQYKFVRIISTWDFSENTIFLAVEPVAYAGSSRKTFINPIALMKNPEMVSEFKENGYSLILIKDIFCVDDSWGQSRTDTCIFLQELDVDMIFNFN